MTSEDIQREFERAWRFENEGLPCDIWLRRTDRWGQPGYVEPVVHKEWLAFQKGFTCGVHAARANPA